MTTERTVNSRDKKPGRMSLPQRKPKLGQNFLSDQNAARQIVEALGDVSGRTVIEIGPGAGAITGLLAQRAQKLIAIEFDRKLTAQLRMDYSTRRHVEIIEADVLSIDFNQLVQGPLLGTTRVTNTAPVTADVVGNLPYYITSDILLKLFAFPHDFRNIVIMVQREVAQRIAAEPGTRDYGVLTVTTQLYADVELLFTLPPTAFSPPPKVHSSVIRMRIAPKHQGLGVDPKQFLSFVKMAFAQKRKTLSNNLKGSFSVSAISKAMKQASIPSSVRAEGLSLAQLSALFLELQRQ